MAVRLGFSLFILLLILLQFPTISQATSWWVRTDGTTYGTDSTHCNGQTDAAYVASGGPNCAVNSLYEIIRHGTDDSGGYAGTTRISGGDTIIIGDPGGTPGSFPIGYNRSSPQTSCSSSYPYACWVDTLPSGSDSSHRTKLYGRQYNTGCTTKTQLYGTQSVDQVLLLNSASHIDIECLDITDHSSCGFRTGGNQCPENYPADVGNYGRIGIKETTGGVSDWVLTNIDIHGMGTQGMNVGGVSGWNMSYVNLDGNHTAGLDGDVGHSGQSSFSGTLVVDNVRTRFNGCAEAYPRSSTFSTSDYSDCTDQNSSGGYGDGWGFYQTLGTWQITNSEWSHNSSDGLDFLYGDTTMDLSIDKSLFEGNVGNQLKFAARNVNVTNSVLIANCAYLTATGKAYNNAIVDCRANGTPIVAVPMAGSAWKIINTSSYSAFSNSNPATGSAFLEVDQSGLGNCNGTETYLLSNNIAVSPNDLWHVYYDGLSGSCATAFEAAATDHSNIYNFETQPSGSGNVFTTANWASSISETADSNLLSVLLTLTSPGKGAGISSNTYWNTSTDYFADARPPWDMGAFIYGSCAATSAYCTVNADCCSGTCTSNACAATPTPPAVTGKSRISGKINLKGTCKI